MSCLIAGTVGLAMYFIQEGIVDVLNHESDVVTSLSDGSYFGEIAPLCNTRRTASVRADTYCNLYSLSREDMLQILSEYPLMRRTIETFAAERLEQLGKDPKIVTQRVDLEDDLTAVKDFVQSLVAHSRNTGRKKRAAGEKRDSQAQHDSDRDADAHFDDDGAKRRGHKKGHKMRLSVDRARSECDSDVDADESFLRKARSRGVRRSIAEKLHEVTKRINKPFFLQVSGTATPRPDKDLKRTSSSPSDTKELKHAMFAIDLRDSGAQEESAKAAGDLDESLLCAAGFATNSSDSNRYLSARRKSASPESTTSNEVDGRDDVEEEDEASDAEEHSRQRHAAESSRGKSFSFLPKSTTFGKRVLDVFAPLKKLSTSLQGASVAAESSTEDNVVPGRQPNLPSPSASGHPKVQGVPALLVGIGLQLGESIFADVNRPLNVKSTAAAAAATTTSAQCSVPPTLDPPSIAFSAPDAAAPNPSPKISVTTAEGRHFGTSHNREDASDFPAMDDTPAVIHLPF